LDLFGRGFVILRLRHDADPAALVNAATAAAIPLQLVDIDQADVVQLYEMALVLVRPDGHVAWRGNDPPSDSPALLRTVAGRA
jgi:hypothetical protein